MTPMCSNCRFWTERTPGQMDDDTNHYGDCQRFPPQVISGATWNTGTAAFPQSNQRAWCGEHQPKQND